MTETRDAQPLNKKDTHSQNGLLMSVMTQVFILTITSFIHTERGGERKEGADPIWNNACQFWKRLLPRLKYPVFTSGQSRLSDFAYLYKNNKTITFQNLLQ